jgi:septal ring factor EnvC (AmiA/AmiB activator)
MDQLWIGLVIALVTSGSFATIVTKTLNKRKDNADVKLIEAERDSVIAEAARVAVHLIRDQLNQCMDEIAKLRTKVALQDAQIVALHGQVTNLNNYVELLRKQIVELGGTPIHPPFQNTEEEYPHE